MAQISVRIAFQKPTFSWMLPAFVLISSALFAPVGRVDGSPACVNGHPTVKAEFLGSEAVFIGTVLGDRAEPPSADGHFDDGTTYQVNVDEPLRGRPAQVVYIFSEDSSGRFPMKRGRKYLLFVSSEHGRTRIDSCGNSEPFSADSQTLTSVRRLATHP